MPKEELANNVSGLQIGAESDSDAVADIQSTGMNTLPNDLLIMFFERTESRNIKHISRVNQKWRTIIAENACQLRTTSPRNADLAIINFSSQLRVRVISNAESEQFNRQIACFESLLIYNLGELHIKDNSVSSGKEEAIKEKLDSLPDWWIKTLKKIHIETVNGVSIYYDFIHRFNQLEKLSFEFSVFNSEEIKRIISETKKVELYHFRPPRNTLTHAEIDDSIFELLIEKSKIKQIRSPEFMCIAVNISLPVLIRFLKLARLVKQPYYEIYITNLIGKKDDWDIFLQNETTPESPTVLKNLKGGEICNLPQFIFKYRGKLWDVCLYHIIDPSGDQTLFKPHPNTFKRVDVAGSRCS